MVWWWPMSYQTVAYNASLKMHPVNFGLALFVDLTVTMGMNIISISVPMILWGCPITKSRTFSATARNDSGWQRSTVSAAITTWMPLTASLWDHRTSIPRNCLRTVKDVYMSITAQMYYASTRPNRPFCPVSVARWANSSGHGVTVSSTPQTRFSSPRASVS